MFLPLFLGAIKFKKKLLMEIAVMKTTQKVEKDISLLK